MILGKKKTIPDNTPKEEAQPKETVSLKDGSNNPAKEQGGASMWGNKGNALVESSMYSDAIQCYDKALEINPKSMEVWNNKGLALARTGRLADAIQCYDKALELHPGDAEAMYNKGIALAQLGKSSEAIDCYDKLLAANPMDAEALCSKGDVLFESGRFEEALIEYGKSIKINPKDETAWNNRGMTFVKLNRFSEAIESYDKALEINPKVEKIWSNKGLAIAKMRENEEKIDLRKLAAALPKEEKMNPFTGTKPEEQSNREPIKQEPVKQETPADKSAQVVPDKAASNERPALFAPVDKDVPVAEPHLPGQVNKSADQPGTGPGPVNEKPHDFQPENTKRSEDRLVMGNNLYSMGKYEEAVEFFNKSLQMYPGNSTAWNNKGLALGKLKKFDEAINCYDKALELNPGDHVILNNKGGALYKKGRIEEAMKCYNSALKLNPDSKTAIRGVEICMESINKARQQSTKVKTMIGKSASA